MQKIFLWFTILIVGFSQFSCKTQQKTHNKWTKSIQAHLDASPVFQQTYTAFVLIDPTTGDTLFAKNADKYFTPASNTKLFTLYAALQSLGETAPSLRFVEKPDSLLFWGTADPSFLHPDFGNTATLQFLNSFPEKKLVFSTSNFSNSSLGNGWSWDDYNDDYQAEISPLPMYGNIVRFQIKDTTGASLNPPLFQNSFFQSNQGQFIQRELEDNQFAVPSVILTKEKYLQDIPFKTSPSLTQQFLMDTLQRFVHLDNLPLPDSATTLYTIPLDTLYKRMMQISDNMVAEHLLLLCATPHKLPLQTAKIIQFIQEKYLTDLPDKPKWVDGSGLSRYNLMTPRSITTLLDKMWRSYPQEKLFSYLAAGGGIGTLSSLYAGNKKPYIFAKSGSMSGVYNQSGYLVTQSGKVLIFSAMNNNFTLPVKTVRQEVGKLMDWIYTQIP